VNAKEVVRTQQDAVRDRIRTQLRPRSLLREFYPRRPDRPPPR
jgi:hypothetical protein